MPSVAGNGGGYRNVVRDIGDEWIAWGKLPRKIRAYLIEQPFEFSSVDALAMWEQINDNPFLGDIGAFDHFKFQIDMNVNAARRAERADKASGRYFQTYYSEHT